MQRLRRVNRAALRRDGHNLFTKLIRTKDADRLRLAAERQGGTRTKLSRCLTTLDLTSLGVGSCAGTGMYLVTGMVARNVAGPGVVLSFLVAALASIFSGVCYAEFGVRVPHTSGSAYMYSYVTVGEFIAFVIGWNMVLEYLIGTSACACALSACFDALFDGAISRAVGNSMGTIFGRAPDVVAFTITLLMMLLLAAGVRKSLIFNNVLNAINLSIWVFVMTAGLFYVDTDNWTYHKGFLPYGWSGVFTGAATCFYAFIGFDIIATTGEEAMNPRRSIPLAIVTSLGIIITAYVSSSIMLTLIVPYDEVNQDSALVEMFGYVGAVNCKFIVAVGAVAGLTVSMFGSMFPMPRIVYAMAQDGLIFRQLSGIWEATGTPVIATIGGGVIAALVALMMRLEVLVEMMSIGTLLAYTLVSTCVLVLRYQPHTTNLIELLPRSLRTPIPTTPPSILETSLDRDRTALHVTFPPMSPSPVVGTDPHQHITIRRITTGSPDSDDSFADEDSRDDRYLVTDRTETNFYGNVRGGTSTANKSMFPFLDPVWAACRRQLDTMAYVCPALFPWVDLGPATEESGMYVTKAVGLMYLLILALDITAAFGSPGSSTATYVFMWLLLLGIFIILLAISKKPQNRSGLQYMAPGLPFVPAIAITVNIYLILKLSILTLVRFAVWMTLGLIMYFRYGIKNSSLEPGNEPESPDDHPPIRIIGERPVRCPDILGSRNIFEGDGDCYGGKQGLYGPDSNYPDPFAAWDQAEQTSGDHPSYTDTEYRYNVSTNQTQTSTVNRPPRWSDQMKPYRYNRTD